MVVHGPYPVGEPRVSREVAAARARGFDVDVVAMGRPGEQHTEVIDGAVVFRLRGSHHRGGSIAQLGLEYIQFTLLAAVTVARLNRRRRYRVVQVHTPPDFLIAAAVVPKLLGSRVILDVHDLMSDLFHSRFAKVAGGGMIERGLRAIEGSAARLADAVVTVHEPYRRAMIARGTDAASVSVVMNSVDESLLPTMPPTESDGSFRIVYHGTVTPSYGVGLIVEAVALLRDRGVKAVAEIYGEGDSVEALRVSVQSLGVGGLVHVNGRYLPHREVLRLVRGASVGVVPNLRTRYNRYALSSKLFEYVALGVPVVCADLPTLREHFDDDEVRFFEPGSAVALAEAIEHVARDPGTASARVEAARGRYESYRWPVNAERYGALLEQLLERKP